MGSLITAPSSYCMIIFMSASLLFMLPQQTHAYPVPFIYCNPLDPFKILVTKIDMTWTIVADNEIVTFEIELGDGANDVDLSTGDATLSLSTFLSSGELLSGLDDSVKFSRNVLSYYLTKKWLTKPGPLGVIYKIILLPPSGDVHMCVKIPYVYL